MALQQFGTSRRQFKSGAAARSQRSPFETAMESAARLREATTPDFMREPTTPQPIDGSPKGVPPLAPSPLRSATPQPLPSPALQTQAAPQFISATTTTTPTPQSAPLQFRTAGGSQVLSQSTPAPQSAPPPVTPNVAVEEKTRAVTPGDPNRTDYYRNLANQYNTAPSRWHGNITEDDVRAFDQYAISYRARGQDGNPSVWDWLAAGRPRTSGDYYDDTAVRYNGYDTPYKGTIHRDDVVAFHAFSKSREAAGLPSMHVIEWLERGKPTAGPTAGLPRGSSGVAIPPGGWKRGSTYGQQQPPPGGSPAPPAGATPPPPTPGSQSVPTGPQPVPQVPPSEPPVTQPQSGPQLENFNDTLGKTIEEITKRFQPGYDRANNDLQQRLMQTGAVTGAVNAGGFTDVVGDALVSQGAEQSKEMGAEISKQVINAQQLAMTKYVAELDDAFKNLQLKTNADLEAKAQELQKYGIDKGDLLERYKAELSLKGVTYSADRQVDAAAMQAAASAAAAASNAAAAKYNADRDYALGLVNADVTREGNIWDGLVRLGLGSADWMKWFMAADPLGIITGNVPPGDVVVKP